MEEKIKEVIDNIRPYLNMDGGDIEYIKYEDGYVYIRMNGACANCLIRDMDVSEGITQMIQEEVKEVKGVINVPL